MLQVAWAGTMPAPDSARNTPVGNSSLGNGSPAFFERAIVMLSLVIDFGFGIGIAATPTDARQKITDKSVRSGNRDAMSVYSWMNFLTTWECRFGTSRMT
ncbi:hypothetical protein [Burkholderia cenocepacia]|uniref:hypothetical protein n=1 Tax=Burkholderia cenocepacia TaxID=95486 RepID=UPI001F3E08DD|nr:hypothetical protein [Burkholderia cenocepacia]